MKGDLLMSPLAKLLKWITFAYEAFLAFPIVGGIFIVANAWTPLGVAFVLHLVTLIVVYRERGPVIGNAAGIVTSMLALIPFLGWFLHGLTALVLLFEGIVVSRRPPRY